MTDGPEHLITGSTAGEAGKEMSEEHIEAARNWLSNTARRDSWDADIAAVWEALVAIGWALVAIAEKP